MEKIIVERAFVKYDKNGEYDHTIQSDFLNFDSEKDARNFINNNIEKNYEYYLYESQECVEKNEHFDVVVSNNILNK